MPLSFLITSASLAVDREGGTIIIISEIQRYRCARALRSAAAALNVNVRSERRRQNKKGRTVDDADDAVQCLRERRGVPIRLTILFFSSYLLYSSDIHGIRRQPSFRSFFLSFFFFFFGICKWPDSGVKERDDDRCIVS